MANCNNSEKICQQRMGVIYKITNLLNGKIYVGQTRQKLNVRLYRHKIDNRPGIDEAIQKYGWENFKAETVEECPCEMLNEREIFWIKELNSMAPNGYNLTSGGERDYTVSEKSRAKNSESHRGKKLSQETCVKMSKSRTGEKNPFYGKHHTEESKAKNAAAHKGNKATAETRAKLSEMQTGEKNNFYGRHHSEESKAKISANHVGMTGKRHSEETKAKISATQKAKFAQNKEKKASTKNPDDISELA